MNMHDIFKSSNLSESKKLAQKVLGRLLIKLRSGEHVRIYSLLDSVSDCEILEDVIKISLSDNSSYLLINNNADKDIINSILEGMGYKLKVDFSCSGEKTLNKVEFEKFLKDEFGKILTIK